VPGLDVNIILIILAVFLLIPISSLAKAFVAVARQKLEQHSKSATLKVLLPLGLIMISQFVHAQVNATANTTGK
jgi:hypothetical protein